MNNIIDILSTTPLSTGGNINLYKNGKIIDNEKKTDYIQKILFRKYKIKEILEAALRSCFIFGGCSVYIDYGDNEYLEQPLDLKEIDGSKFKGFRLINPIMTSAIEVNSWNPASPTYMSPRKWYIEDLGIVDSSRLIHFEYNTPPLELKPMTMYYGMPLTQLLKQDIANVNLVSQGLANLVNKIRRTYIKMDKQVFASGNMQAVKNRLRTMQEVENNFTVFPIDLSEDVIQLNTSLANIDSTVETFLNILSVKTGIPRNRLLGVSTGGLNAYVNQSESEKNFVSRIDAIRESLIKTNLERMLQIVAKTLEGNELYDIDYTFMPLFNLSEKDNAELISRNMDIALKMRSLGIDKEDCLQWLRSREINDMRTIRAEETKEEENENN